MTYTRLAQVQGTTPEEALRNKVLAESAPALYERLRAILENPILLDVYEQAVHLTEEIEDRVARQMAEFHPQP